MPKLKPLRLALAGTAVLAIVGVFLPETQLATSAGSIQRAWADGGDGWIIIAAALVLGAAALVFDGWWFRGPAYAAAVVVTFIAGHDASDALDRVKHINSVSGGHIQATVGVGFWMVSVATLTILALLHEEFWRRWLAS